MAVLQQVDARLKLFNQILRETKKLKLREVRPLSGRPAYYVVGGALDAATKQTDLVLSFEFLGDLVNTERSA